MTVISTQQGNLKDSARYYPFGGRRVTPTHEITDNGYTGHQHNDDLGLIYMVARYYDPALRRFISADTIVPDMLDTGAYNRFAYVNNSPVNFTDPTGHCVEDPYDEYVDHECWEKAYELSNRYGIDVEYFAAMTLEQLLKVDYARVAAYTLWQLALVQAGELTDAEAAMAILRYAIETVAEGNLDQGFIYIASVFYRGEFSSTLYNPRPEIRNQIDAGYKVTILAEKLGLGDGKFPFGNTGFHDLYSDVRGNQVQHFLRLAALAQFNGSTIGFVGVTINDRDPTDKDYVADRALGYLAVDMVGSLESSDNRYQVYARYLYILLNGPTSGGLGRGAVE